MAITYRILESHDIEGIVIYKDDVHHLVKKGSRFTRCGMPVEEVMPKIDCPRRSISYPLPNRCLDCHRQFCPECRIEKYAEFQKKKRKK